MGCRTVAVLVLLASGLLAADTPPGGEQAQDFAADPGWEGFRNRLAPDPPRATRQHFGHRTANRAGGKQAGEIAGPSQP